MGLQGAGEASREQQRGLPSPLQSTQGLPLDPRPGWWAHLPPQQRPTAHLQGVLLFPWGQLFSDGRPSGLGPLNSTWRASAG